MRGDDVPAAVREHAGLLLADMAGVCIAGRSAPASRMAADYASATHAGDQACALLDGRRLSAVGAAFANGVLANVLDFDDGHRLTKGHPGAVVIPAALAAAQLADASPEDLLNSVIVGYEVAIRAGIALHAHDPAYHASGAWGSLGAAAATARLLGLDRAALLAALGLAEYHAPIAPIMRSCAQPAMTKDACAWGAAVGVGSALLAQSGFSSVDAELLQRCYFDDLGSRWHLTELYVKQYPCCRWSQAAIAAALQATAGRRLSAREVRSVRVRTFAAADGLAKCMPRNTEEAQYNLVWPVAVALAHGDFDERDVLGPFGDEEVARIAELVEVTVDPAMTEAFPALRVSAVEVQLHDGSELSAGPLQPRGEEDDPEWAQLVRAKFARLVDPDRDLQAPPGDVHGIRRLTPAQLLALISRGVHPLDAVPQLA